MFFVIGAFIAFFIAKQVSGSHEGEQGLISSLKFETAKHTIWVHHWILYALALANVLLYAFLLNDFLYITFLGLECIAILIVFSYAKVLKSPLHWIPLLALLIINVFFLVLKNYIFTTFYIGILTGATLQGLGYNDWNNILVAKKQVFNIKRL